MKNNVFDIARILSEVIVEPTNYTLEESGLINEISVAGDQLNIAKIRLSGSGDGETLSENAIKLENTITNTLTQVPGINNVRIKWRWFTDLSHCPTEIQHLF